MIKIRSVMHVAGLKGIEVTTFLLNPTDIGYRMWWKGTHLQLHPVKGSTGTDKAVYMDEYIGARPLRIRFGLVSQALAASWIRYFASTFQRASRGPWTST